MPRPRRNRRLRNVGRVQAPNSAHDVQEAGEREHRVRRRELERREEGRAVEEAAGVHVEREERVDAAHMWRWVWGWAQLSDKRCAVVVNAGRFVRNTGGTRNEGTYRCRVTSGSGRCSGQPMSSSCVLRSCVPIRGTIAIMGSAKSDMAAGSAMSSASAGVSPSSAAMLSMSITLNSTGSLTSVVEICEKTESYMTASGVSAAEEVMNICCFRVTMSAWRAESCRRIAHAGSFAGGGSAVERRRAVSKPVRVRRWRIGWCLG